MLYPSKAKRVLPSDETPNVVSELREPPESCPDRFQVPVAGSREQSCELPDPVRTGARRTRVRLFVRITFSTLLKHEGTVGAEPLYP